MLLQKVFFFFLFATSYFLWGEPAIAKKAVVKEEKPFVILVLSFNNDAYVKKNSDSIFSQAYQNYQVIYIDDCSTDNTYQSVKHYLKVRGKEDKVTLIHNQKNLGALHNIYKAVHACSNEKILFIIDGDDSLYSSALEDLNSYYANEDVWMTYGQYGFLSRKYRGNLLQPMTESFLKMRFCRYCWIFSHLRTFYAGLFKQLDLSHLAKESKYFPMPYDLAIMFPMLKIAKDHAYFVPATFFSCNYENPINVYSKEQRRLDKYIRSLPFYPKLFLQPEAPIEPYSPYNSTIQKFFSPSFFPS